MGCLHRQDLHPVQNLAPDDVTEQDGSAFICNIITKLSSWPVTHFLLEWLHATPSGKDDITGLGG